MPGIHKIIVENEEQLTEFLSSLMGINGKSDTITDEERQHGMSVIARAISAKDLDELMGISEEVHKVGQTPHNIIHIERKAHYLAISGVIRDLCVIKFGLEAAMAWAVAKSAELEAQAKKDE